MKFLPTIPADPFSAATIRHVFPELSKILIWPPWLSINWRHSTWSVRALACRGVLKKNNEPQSQEGRQNYDSNQLAKSIKLILIGNKKASMNE